jgi:hypothetical protein
MNDIQIYLLFKAQLIQVSFSVYGAHTFIMPKSPQTPFANVLTFTV